MSHLASQSAQPPLPAYLPGMIRQHIYEPCIPTRGTNARAGPDWLHEIKHDGYRLIVQREGKRVRLLTRRGYDWSDRDPLIAQAALRLRKSSFVIYGEAVVLGPDGISDFAALYAGKRNDEGRLYAFDLLHGDGVDMRDETLQIRKLWLANLLKRSTDGIILNDHESGEIGPDLFRQACKMDLRESSETSRERLQSRAVEALDQGQEPEVTGDGSREGIGVAERKAQSISARPSVSANTGADHL